MNRAGPFLFTPGRKKKKTKRIKKRKATGTCQQVFQSIRSCLRLSMRSVILCATLSFISLMKFIKTTLIISLRGVPHSWLMRFSSLSRYGVASPPLKYLCQPWCLSLQSSLPYSKKLFIHVCCHSTKIRKIAETPH